MTLPEGTRYQLLAPVVRGKKGTHSKLISGLAAEGFARIRINHEVRELADNIELDKPVVKGSNSPRELSHSVTLSFHIGSHKLKRREVKLVVDV